MSFTVDEWKEVTRFRRELAGRLMLHFLAGAHADGEEKVPELLELVAKYSVVGADALIKELK